MSLLTEMDPLMTMNQYTNRDCTYMMQIKPSCVLTVKLPFAHVETTEIMEPLLCSTSETLELLPLQIIQTDYS